MRATVGAPFVVELPSTPTTGYRWEASDLAGDVDLIDQQFAIPSDAQPGDSGVQRFRLVAASPGRRTLSFVLRRSWEREGIDTRTVEVEVT